LGSSAQSIVLDANGNPVHSSHRNKRKRRRKKKKKKTISVSDAVDRSDGSKDVIGTGMDHFDDAMSVVSTTTIDTCTTVDTSDFSDVHLRPNSRLSRSNSQVEKRQRILFRNSRHSLDDEPLPLEDPEELYLEEETWDQEEHHEDMQPIDEPVEVGEEGEIDEEEDDDEDDEAMDRRFHAELAELDSCPDSEDHDA